MRQMRYSFEWKELGLDEMVLHRKEGRRGARRNIQLAIDILKVIADSLGDYCQFLSDFAIRQPLRDQPQHLYLALG